MSIDKVDTLGSMPPDREPNKKDAAKNDKVSESLFNFANPSKSWTDCVQDNINEITGWDRSLKPTSYYLDEFDKMDKECEELMHREVRKFMPRFVPERD